MNRLAQTVAVCVAGVAFYATPVSARTQSSDPRGIPCPAMPPSANVVSSKDGTFGLQLPGFGISGNRAKIRSEGDVVIQAEGFDAWTDMVLLKQACEAIRQRHPGDATRQLGELVKFRESLRRPASNQNIQQVETGISKPFSPTQSNPDAFGKPVEAKSHSDINAGQALMSKSGIASVKPTVINMAAGNEADAIIAAALSGEANGSEQKAGQTISSPPVTAAAEAPATPHDKRSYAIDMRAQQGCGSNFVSSGYGMQNCSSQTNSSGTTTCVSIPQSNYTPAIMVGNMMIGGFVSSSGSMSCTTSF